MTFTIKNLCYFTIILILFVFAAPVSAADYDYDLAINYDDIYFSEDVLIAGDQVRIYATVHNVGSEDIVGYVSFFRGIELIGNSQPVSVLPNGSDDVFVDFVVPDTSFNVLARIQGTDPADQNSSNNEDQTNLIHPDFDTDGDGVVDRLDSDDDNDGLTDVAEGDSSCTDPLLADTDGDGINDQADQFPCDASETMDTDGDGQGNNADVDDDNDGWSDSQEQSSGTDPLRKDTDGDGVNDPQDFYPLDSAQWQEIAVIEPRNIFQPPVNQNSNQDETPSGTINQNLSTLEDMEQQLGQFGATSEVSKKLAGQPLEKLGLAVEKVSSGYGKFFRWNNILLWLGLIIILLIVAIIVWLKSKKATYSVLKMDALVQKKEVKKTQPTMVRIDPRSKPRPPHIVDLKGMMKK